MNLSLIDKLLEPGAGLLATIIATEGHTYKKPGAKAYFREGDIAASHGSLGALCVDQEVVERGKGVLADGKPQRFAINLDDETDIHFGHGTYCGGSMEVLLEPVTDRHRETYLALKEILKSGHGARLVHRLKHGDITIDDDAEDSDDVFVEQIGALTPLFIFGATPLARTIVEQLMQMDFLVGVIDWRRAYLDQFSDLRHIERLEDAYPFNSASMVIVVSHGFERDLHALGHALAAECRYVGLLSSRKRRDKMFQELRENGTPQAAIDRIHSPVGIDIGARSDPEIAASIVAELVQCKNA